MMKEYLQKYKKESFELDQEDFLGYLKKIQTENEVLKRGIIIQNQKWDTDRTELQNIKNVVANSEISRVKTELAEKNEYVKALEKQVKDLFYHNQHLMNSKIDQPYSTNGFNSSNGGNYGYW